jgi:hypothetical protein
MHIRTRTLRPHTLTQKYNSDLFPFSKGYNRSPNVSGIHAWRVLTQTNKKWRAGYFFMLTDFSFPEPELFSNFASENYME